MNSKTLVLLLFFGCACKHSPRTTENPNENNNITKKVDSKSELPEQYSNLSPEDRLKLANASGPKAKLITLKQLKSNIKNTKGLLHAYAFWLLDQPESIEFIFNLRKLQAEIGEQHLKLILVNLDSVEKSTYVNTFIREKGISEDIYMLEADVSPNWQNEIHRSWDGTIPAVLFENQSNGTHILYQQILNFEELLVIAQPLSL